ncbi:MAG: tetratricopeptide repeat protein, partial [Patescibacteria group bacterium]|nr:tetratricopeptide repeat protein [Patescibacteria group bacterium]
IQREMGGQDRVAKKGRSIGVADGVSKVKGGVYSSKSGKVAKELVDRMTFFLNSNSDDWKTVRQAKEAIVEKIEKTKKDLGSLEDSGDSTLLAVVPWKNQLLVVRIGDPLGFIKKADGTIKQLVPATQGVDLDGKAPYSLFYANKQHITVQSVEIEKGDKILLSSDGMGSTIYEGSANDQLREVQDRVDDYLGQKENIDFSIKNLFDYYNQRHTELRDILKQELKRLEKDSTFKVKRSVVRRLNKFLDVSLKYDKDVLNLILKNIDDISMVGMEISEVGAKPIWQAKAKERVEMGKYPRLKFSDMVVVAEDDSKNSMIMGGIPLGDVGGNLAQWLSRQSKDKWWQLWGGDYYQWEVDQEPVLNRLWEKITRQRKLDNASKQPGLEPKQPPTLRRVADLLRQQAGIDIKDKLGQSIGTMIPEKRIEYIRSLSEEDRTGNERKILAWSEVESNNNLVAVETQLEGSVDQTLKAIGLGQLRKQVSRAVNQYVLDTQADSGLVIEDVTQPESLAYQIVLAKEKLARLANIKEGLDAGLQDNIKRYHDFLENDLIPLLDLTQTETGTINQSIFEFLDTSRDKGKHQGKNYQQRAQVIFSSERAQGRYQAIVETDKQVNLTAKLEEDVIRLGSTVNLIRLMSLLGDEYGIDFVETKENIANILEQMEAGDGYNQALIEQLADQISPITNGISDRFKHDTVYLMGQALEREEAMCAGKAVMIANLLDLMGLDANISNVTVDYKRRGISHTNVVVRLPQSVFLTLDANFYRQKKDRFGFTHNASIIFPTDKIIPYTNVKKFNRYAGKTNFYYKFKNRNKILVAKQFGWQVYFVKKGNTHKLYFVPTKYDRTLSHNNFGVFIIENPGVFGDKEKAVRLAEYHYKKALEINPNYVVAHNNLASLIRNNLDLFGDKEKAVRLAEYHYKKALEINPNYIGARNNFVNLILYNPSFFGGKEEELVKLFEHCFKQDLEIQSEDVVVYNNFAHITKKNLDLFKNKKRAVLAVQHYYKKALELKPDYIAPLINVSELIADYNQWFEVEDFEWAVKNLEKAIKLYPSIGVDKKQNLIDTKQDLEDLMEQEDEIELGEDVNNAINQFNKEVGVPKIRPVKKSSLIMANMLKSLLGRIKLKDTGDKINAWYQYVLLNLKGLTKKSDSVANAVTFGAVTVVGGDINEYELAKAFNETMDEDSEKLWGSSIDPRIEDIGKVVVYQEGETMRAIQDKSQPVVIKLKEEESLAKLKGNMESFI